MLMFTCFYSLKSSQQEITLVGFFSHHCQFFTFTLLCNMLSSIYVIVFYVFPKYLISASQCPRLTLLLSLFFVLSSLFCRYQSPGWHTDLPPLMWFHFCCLSSSPSSVATLSFHSLSFTVNCILSLLLSSAHRSFSLDPIFSPKSFHLLWPVFGWKTQANPEGLSLVA